MSGDPGGTAGDGPAPEPEQGKKRSEAPKVDFPPVANGLDYLLSVTEHLTAADPPTPRHLKYAVVHLQAAVEVLLKARLQQEHWTLVVAENVDQMNTTRTAFDSGNFVSCTIEQALARLTKAAGTHATDDQAKALRSLTLSRNALQHYGLRLNAHQVEANAAEVLDFLMSFVHSELLPALSATEVAQARRDLWHIRQRLGTIRSFVKKRHQQIRTDLAPHQSTTVQCPQCSQPAVVIGTPLPACLFCHATWPDAMDLAYSHVSATGDYEAGVETCPDCAEYAVIPNATVAARPKHVHARCFACAASPDLRETCEKCGTRYPAMDDSVAEHFGQICGQCIVRFLEEA
ncbi:hypothetical protein ACIO3O_36795 [Streptomyces sp. NPDC087440]|uniref:hypothetical protein n=1 Tax=Streptomyces sp. NPDC087440 TaxID=3365790 RepID=UPI00380A0F0B